MAPKEKALELLNKYLCIDDDIDLFCDECGMSEEAAKQCALIAVDEIMSQYKTPVVSHIVTTYKSAEDFSENFLDIERRLKDFTGYQILWWNSVKNEINNL